MGLDEVFSGEMKSVVPFQQEMCPLGGSSSLRNKSYFRLVFYMVELDIGMDQPYIYLDDSAA